MAEEEHNGRNSYGRKAGPILQTFEPQLEAVQPNREIPEYLLERTAARRAQLGLPTRQQEMHDIQAQTDLDKRLSGIIDLASEPCSLLAEHISTETGKKMMYACPEVHSCSVFRSRSSFGDTTGISQGFIVDSPDERPVPTEYYYVRLADKVEGDPRIESLDLVAAIKLVTVEYKKRFRKHTETHYQICNPNQKYIDAVNSSKYRGFISGEQVNDYYFPPTYAYVVANTRGDIAIPLFGVAIERKRPDCSLVNPIESGLGADISKEVLVGRDEVEDRSVREESFKELLRILTDNSARKRRIEELAAEQKGFRVVRYSMPELVADLGKLAVIDRINSVIGVPNEAEDKVVSYAQDALSKGKNPKGNNPQSEVKRRIGRKIVVNNIAYDGLMEVTIRSEENARIHIDTEVSLPGAPNLPPQDVFPNVRIYKGSDHPVNFDGIEYGSSEHQTILNELVELLGIM